MFRKLLFTTEAQRHREKQKRDFLSFSVSLCLCGEKVLSFAGFLGLELASERYARYLGVARDGFVALSETGGGKVQLFGEVGYHVREGRKQKAVGRKGHEPYTIASPKQLLAAAFFIRLAFQFHPQRRRRSAQASSLVDSS